MQTDAFSRVQAEYEPKNVVTILDLDLKVLQRVPQQIKI